MFTYTGQSNSGGFESALGHVKIRRMERKSGSRPIIRRKIHICLAAFALVAVVAAAFTAHRHQKFERTGDAARLADGRKPVLLIAGADAGYVDGAACIGCHRAIWESYRQTGMGRSLSQLSPGAVIADFERNNSFYHQASDRYYTMYRKDGQYYERRHQIGFDGKETNVIEQQIDFVIGSGNH